MAAPLRLAQDAGSELTFQFPLPGFQCCAVSEKTPPRPSVSPRPQCHGHLCRTSVSGMAIELLYVSNTDVTAVQLTTLFHTGDRALARPVEQPFLFIPRGPASKPCPLTQGALRPGQTLALAVAAAKLLLLPGPPSPSSGKTLVTAGPIPADGKPSRKMLWTAGDKHGGWEVTLSLRTRPHGVTNSPGAPVLQTASRNQWVLSDKRSTPVTRPACLSVATQGSADHFNAKTGLSSTLYPPTMGCGARGCGCGGCAALESERAA
ncbi:hypothetical protein E5288_WYG016138 [Bos mutus]|uniref:Uncharacterized protein n=1 Tax=Bos mutus TaxID=72004 RepID=A0A6B0RRC2_9CETA|nr:hypothetical protein [Bos mutus]